MNNKDYVLAHLGELMEKVDWFKQQSEDSIASCNYEVIKEDIDYIMELVEKCF